MITSFLAGILATVSAASQWSPVPQPAGTAIQNATILPGGAWVGVDSMGLAWTTTTRGANWGALSEDSQGAGWGIEIMAGGLVLEWAKDGSYYHRYDAASRSWTPAVFDRRITTGSGLSETGDMWDNLFGGVLHLWIEYPDSVLAFQSSDTGRTWKTAASLGQFDIPGGLGDWPSHTSFVGARLWVSDTVRRVLKSTLDGKTWWAIPFPVDILSETIVDSLAGGFLVGVGKRQDGTMAWNSTADSGKTWVPYDASRPGSVPSLGLDLSGKGTLSPTFDGQAEGDVFFRAAGSNSWTALPTGYDVNGDFFTDAGRLYSAGPAGLLSMDLGTVSVRSGIRSPSARTWRIQGTDLLISGVKASHWALWDLSGRSLATGISSGTDLRIPMGDRRGMLLVQLDGDKTSGFPVFVPGNLDRR